MRADAVQIRKTTSADAPALVVLLQAAYEEYRGRLDPPSGAHGESPANIANLLANEEALAATADGAMVGAVFFDLAQDPVWLHKLAVAPAWRRRGIGAALMEAAEARVVAAGLSRIQLAARIPLPANHRYYQRLGYTIVDARAHPGYTWPTFYLLTKDLAHPVAVSRQRIEVVPYDPTWVDHFAAEAERLRAVIEPDLLAIHHIGSTAIVNIHAKPIIDILPVVRDIRVMDTLIPQMAALGYEAKGEYGIPGRRYFRRVIDNVHTHHVHAFAEGHPDIARHVDFCAYLNAHPADARRYEAIKLRMAALHPHDIVAYNDGKGPLIREIEGKMRDL